LGRQFGLQAFVLDKRRSLIVRGRIVLVVVVRLIKEILKEAPLSGLRSSGMILQYEYIVTSVRVSTHISLVGFFSVLKMLGRVDGMIDYCL
jgi:hypothetical protein